MKGLHISGKKVGMTRVFDKDGNLVVCTVIQVEPNTVVQVKTAENDGYNALQLGAGKLAPSRKKNLTKPMAKKFEKAGVDPKKLIKESRIDNVKEYKVGDELNLSQFEGAPFVDITAVSKGKGYQGVMRRHGFKGGPAAHGSGFHRHAGSTGMRSTPGRVFRGHKMPGRMGFEKITTQNLKVISIDAENQVMLVKGAVAGPRGAMVFIKQSVKKAIA